MIGKDKLDYQSIIVSYFKTKQDDFLTLKIFNYNKKLKIYGEFKYS